MNPMGVSPGERRIPGELFDIQGSPPSSSRTVDPDNQENKQSWQETCRDEKGAPD